MSWEAYYKEIRNAKDEYDQAVKPAMKTLDNVHKYAWARYIKKIKQAEIFLKEDQL